jgi:hypothetical protein
MRAIPVVLVAVLAAGCGGLETTPGACGWRAELPDDVGSALYEVELPDGERFAFSGPVHDGVRVDDEVLVMFDEDLGPSATYRARAASAGCGWRPQLIPAGDESGAVETPALTP